MLLLLVLHFRELCFCIFSSSLSSQGGIANVKREDYLNTFQFLDKLAENLQRKMEAK